MANIQTTTIKSALSHPAYILACIFVLAGCAGTEKTTAPPAKEVVQAVALENQQPTDDAVRFSIIPDESEVRILTFRDGPMARLGHNHVIVSKTLSGTVWIEPELNQSLAEINLPVASFEVDDPAERANEGDGFSTPIPENARSGTRENMMGESVLNASRYAFIRARCGDLQTGDAGSLRCIFSIAGKNVTLNLPITYTIDGTRLTASGEAAISHQQLGLQAFSAGGGAIRVAEEITVRYRLTAQQLSR